MEKQKDTEKYNTKMEIILKVISKKEIKMVMENYYLEEIYTQGNLKITAKKDKESLENTTGM